MNKRSKLTSPNSSSNDSTDCDATTVKCSNPKCEFDLTVKLVGSDEDRILTPLCIPDFEELVFDKKKKEWSASKSNGTKNRDYINFEVEITGNKVDNAVLEITAGKDAAMKTVYSEILKPEYQNVGKHLLKWDGYSNAGILDTKILKDPDLKLKVAAELCGVKKEKTIEFDNEYAEEDWVDVVISGKQVTVELRVDIDDGGENGVGEYPPPGAQATKDYQSFRKDHPAREKHQRVQTFDELKTLALNGLEKYWSRTISTAKGNYSVKTMPILKTEKAMDDIKVEYKTNGRGARSSNPGPVCGLYSLIGNIIIAEHIVYNVGWIKYDGEWYYVPPAHADKNFKDTSAHEIGHGILIAYGGENYSYGHRGSSTIITQIEKKPKRGGEKYPPKGEIDLMKYYYLEDEEYAPHDLYDRLKASEMDVASLVWLARVQFDD